MLMMRKSQFSKGMISGLRSGRRIQDHLHQNDRLSEGVDNKVDCRHSAPTTPIIEEQTSSYQNVEKRN